MERAGEGTQGREGGRGEKCDRYTHYRSHQGNRRLMEKGQRQRKRRKMMVGW